MILVPDSCCDASIDLQESSYLTQIQCLPPSNNNINSKEILLNTSNAQNEESSLVPIESRNCEYTITNKIGTTTLHTTIKYSDKKPNVSIHELNASNKININNSYTQTNRSSVDIEDDLNTTQALMSLAMKISEQDKHFRFDDGFEDEMSTNSNNQNMIDEISVSNLSPGKNGNPHIESHKMDEDLSKIKNSLKLLESLVNIEHNKLEVQKTLTENEQQELNVKLNGKKIVKDLCKTNKHYNYKKRENKSLEKEHSPKNKKQKTNSKNKNEFPKAKNIKLNYNKLESQINLENMFSNNSIEIINKQNNSLNNNSLLISSSSNKSESRLHSIANTKSLDNTISFETILESTKKDNSSTHNLKAHLFDFISTSVDKSEYNRVIDNDNDALLIKNSLTASTSTCNEKIGNTLKMKSSDLPSLPMKRADYKKLYEMDRKSLFSPDIIISSKPTNNCKTKDKSKQTKQKKTKTQTSKPEKKTTRSVKRKTSNLKVKFTSIPKVQTITEPKSNQTSTAPYKTLPHDISTADDGIFKKPKTEYEADSEDTVFKADSSKKVEVKEMEVLENNKLTNDFSDNDTVIQRLLEKYACHNIKPIYVVLDRCL